MREKHVIVSDGREIKVFQVQSEMRGDNKRVTLVLLKDFSNTEGHKKISELYSDRLGGFKDSTTYGGGTNEPKLNLEIKRKYIKYISDSINEIMNPMDSDIYFSAPHFLLKRIQSGLSKNIRGRLKKSLPKNLVGMPEESLILEFGLL